MSFNEHVEGHIEVELQKFGNFRVIGKAVLMHDRTRKVEVLVVFVKSEAFQLEMWSVDRQLT